jgi:hypothetical protein
VVGVAIVVMKVSFQRLTGFRLCIPSIGSRLLFEAVAVIPACTVFRPEAHAHPAEFMLALSAGHVVATTVLLNGGLALGAFLCVRRYPVGGLRIILALFKPLLYERARGRQMVVEIAPETKVVFARAVHCWHDFMQVLLSDTTFNSEFTIRSWAPLKIIFIVHECADK